MNNIYLLLGGNMGDRINNLSVAITLIEQKIGKVYKHSSLYQTVAWGNNDQPDFLNQVILIKTKFSASKTMKIILTIENDMGRIRTIKNAPRIIDIDILFFNEAIINTPNLTIPHPEIANRKFVLIPLSQISPDLKHPVLNKSVIELLNLCKDNLAVKLFA